MRAHRQGRRSKSGLGRVKGTKVDSLQESIDWAWSRALKDLNTSLQHGEVKILVKDGKCSGCGRTSSACKCKESL